MTAQRVSSADTSLRRFLVLEDSDQDFGQESRFLCELCRAAFSGKADPPKKVEILRVHSTIPVLYRDSASYLPPTRRADLAAPEWLTAPIMIDAQGASLHCYEFSNDGWILANQSPASIEKFLIVPWQTSWHSPAEYFMPHAVLLDIVTAGTDAPFVAMKRFLRGAGFPSDLVWILSGGRGANDSYGIFFPKYEFLSHCVDQRGELLRRMGNVFYRHAMFKGTKAGSSDRTAPSYRPEKVAEFYHEFVIPEAWRGRIDLCRCSVPEVDMEQLKSLWSEDRKGADQRVRWTIEPTPQRAECTLTFFPGSLEGEQQWLYISSETFGLPLDYLWDYRKCCPKPPEDVIVEAALKYSDPRTNFVLLRNLAVFLYSVLGSKKSFDSLNHAVPSITLSHAKFHNISIEAIYGEIEEGGKQPFEAWYKDRFIRGYGHAGKQNE